MGRGVIITYDSPPAPLPDLIWREYDPSAWVFQITATRLFMYTSTGVVAVTVCENMLCIRRTGTAVQVVYTDSSKLSVKLYVVGTHRYVRVGESGTTRFTLFRRMGTTFRIRPAALIECEDSCIRRMVCTMS